MNIFNLKLHNTTIYKELISGITTFIAMSYVLVVNPRILEETGINVHGVFIGTVIACVLTTIIGAFYTKLPFGYAPGMSMSILFVILTDKLCGGDYSLMLLATYFSGVLMIVLIITDLYEPIIKVIPSFVKYGVISGFGIAIIIKGINQFEFAESLADGWNQIFLCLIGLLVYIFSKRRKKKSAIMISLGVIYLITAVCKIGELFISGSYVLQASIPTYFIDRMQFRSIMETGFCFPKFSLIFSSKSKLFELISATLIMTIMHFFDAYATASFITEKIKKEDPNYNLSGEKKTMLVNGIGSIISACTGTSSVTTYAESITGVEVGAKTGLSAVVISLCFMATFFMMPFIGQISCFILAPALILVGITLLENIVHVKNEGMAEVLSFLFLAIGVGITLQIGPLVVYSIVFYQCLLYLTGRKMEQSKYWYMIAFLGMLCGIILIASMRG